MLHDPYLCVISTPALGLANSRERGCQADRHLDAEASKLGRYSVVAEQLSNLRRNITATFRRHLLPFYGRR